MTEFPVWRYSKSSLSEFASIARLLGHISRHHAHRCGRNCDTGISVYRACDAVEHAAGTRLVLEIHRGVGIRAARRPEQALRILLLQQVRPVPELHDQGVHGSGGHNVYSRTGRGTCPPSAEIFAALAVTLPRRKNRRQFVAAAATRRLAISDFDASIRVTGILGQRVL